MPVRKMRLTAAPSTLLSNDVDETYADRQTSKSCNAAQQDGHIVSQLAGG